MSFRCDGGKIWRHAGCVLMVMAMSAFAWGQHKTNSSKPSPPPQHSAPPQHSNAPAHPSNGGGHNGNMSGSHGSTGQHNQTMGGNRNGNMGSGNRNGTMGGNRNGTMGGNRNSTMGGNRNSTTGGTRNGNMGPNNKGFGNKGPANGMNNRGPAGRGGPGGMNARGPHVAPGRQVSLKGGGSAQIRPNGQIRSINRNGMQIQRGVRGERRIVSTRNGVRVVSVGRGRGYVQRAYFNRGGRAYYSRTYYYHGVYRTGVYRGYYWHGRPYYGYYPPYYYHPGYYGWVYNPWPAPVYYSWGWGPAPWYGYYGPYFAPYPVYPSAAFWITDFMIAATLQAAYEAQANAVLYPNAADGTLVASLLPMAAEGSDAVKLSPEVKNALAEEVKSETAAEQADASKSGGSASSGGQPSDSNEAPPALDPKFRYFVISSDETLVADGQECDLSQGDVIMRTSDAADDDGNVNVKVVGSSKSDCAVGTEGPIALDDLQEMYNQFRDQLKNGMAELAKKNGSGGLPKAPDTSTVTGDVPPPPPDKSAEKDLQEQQSAADQTESEVKQEAASDSGGGQ